MNSADKESIRVMLAELRELQDWISHAEITTDNEEYTAAIERAQEIRKRLGLPELD